MIAVASSMTWFLRIFFAAVLLSQGFAPSLLALDPARSLTQYTHRVWTEEEGLQQPTIYSIQQTRDGFLWIGTQDGLLRFDGLNFLSFDNVGSSFEHSLVRALAQDSRGNLWAASIGNGILRIRPGGSLTHFDTKSGLPSDEVFCLANGTDGSLWACTNQGLARHHVDRDPNRWQTFSTADGLSSNRIRAFCQSQDGAQWVATAESPLNRGWNGRFNRFIPEGGPAIPNSTTALACASDGSVWVGTDAGVYRIANDRTRRYSVRQGLLDDSVATIAEGVHGSVWVGTRNGLSRFRTGADGLSQVSNFSTKDGLSHSGVQALFIDREGIVWAGTKAGLDQFTNGNLALYTRQEGLPGDSVGPVIQDERGHLWLGVDGRGLAEFDGHRFRALSSRDGLAGKQVAALQIDRQGDIWAGSEGGVNRIRQGHVVGTWSGASAPAGQDVRSLIFDNDGTLWAGTPTGLSALRGSRFVAFKPASEDLPGQATSMGDIAALGLGPSAALIVSTNPTGLYQFAGAGPTPIPLSAPTRAVASYFVDEKEKALWMGTLGSGLLLWQNGKVVHIRTRDGLYDNRIYGMVADDDSNLWFASSKGIFSVNRHDLYDFAAGVTHRVKSIPFRSGQLRFECQAVQPAAVRGRDGRLWFSTDHGLLMVDPRQLANDAPPFPVQITSTLLNGQPAQLQSLHLPGPFPKNLEIRYTGLMFGSERLMFRYMLAGYDKAWIDAGTRREAFYTSLPPGRFQFLVQARNGNGAWSSQSAPLEFTIDPSLVQRPVFWAIVATCIGFLILIGFRMRIRNLTVRFDHVLAERERIARELHDTLLQGLAGITMQLQALSMRLPFGPDRERLAGIIEDARDCSSEARRSLLGLRSASIAPEGFAAHLTELARRIVGGTEAALRLDIDHTHVGLAPDIEGQLLRIAQEALLNAARHAGAASINVVLQVEPARLTIAIADDGIGFDTDAPKHGHFGLIGMRERARLAGASVHIASTAAEGTRVTICAPHGLPQRRHWTDLSEKVRENQMEGEQC